jgi:PAS domain S-box-containing protein
VIAALRDTAPPTGARLDAIHAALSAVQSPSDSGRPIELWSARGRRLAFVGHDVTEQLTLQIPSEVAAPATSPRPGLELRPATDSVQLGTLYRSGNRTFFWVAVPIVSNGRTLGFLLRQDEIARNPQAERTIEELSGNSAVGYYHNIDGSMWTTIGGVPARAPDTLSSRDASLARPVLGSVIYADEPIAGTQLALAMEVPRAAVIERVAASVRRLALLSGVFTLVGALIAWLIGRRVARPLRDLTTAAESVARGDYSARVPTAGNEEVSRLASSFNRMASQVGESRALLEAREAELHTLANTIPQIAWMADAAGNTFWYNDRWYEYTGLKDNHDLAMLGVEAIDSADLPAVQSAWEESVRTGAPFEMELRLRGRDGSVRWFLTRIAPVRDRDGKVVRWFGTSTDIQALREAREAAEAGNRAKSDFLAAMSHELRTPLNAIGGYAELIDMGLRGPVSEEQRRDLARIRTSQAHLLGLIGALLDLSRIENGHVAYDLQSIGVDSVLADIEALVLPQATAKSQTLVCETNHPDLAVRADREKLRQVLLNLLSNAVRHSPDGAMISVTAERRGPERVAVMVHDTGPGIPHDRQDSIFEPFVQLDRSLTRTSEGVGLGLAISRDLARGMGGDITVVSAPGEGACFMLELPAAVMDSRTQLARSAEMAAVKVPRHA